MKTLKASWNGTVIAESSETIKIEGNHYFPPSSLKKEYFVASDLHSSCPWKGVASYYDIAINGEVNKDAAWYYPNALEKAIHVKDYVAFWKGVSVE